jgi:hypothetical protein
MSTETELPTELYGYQIESLAFDGPKDGPDRGFTMRAFYLKEPFNGDALIEVFRDGEVLRKFLWPAYKMWNLTAHSDDIFSGELEGSPRGYEMAGWSGFPCVAFVPTEPTTPPDL